MLALISNWPFWALLGFVVVYAVADRRYPQFINTLEETVIAILLALMTIITFTQVVARYGFNSGWTSALELTRVLFAWLILFGMSYSMKIGAHLGVDAVIQLFPKPLFRATAIFGAVACVLWAVILISADWLNLLGAETKGGAIFYWERMFKIGIGLEDLKYPDWAQAVFGLDERVHRWLAYLILPMGLGLFAFRSIQALIAIVTGKQSTIIASHEAEDLVAEHKGVLED